MSTLTKLSAESPAPHSILPHLLRCSKRWCMFGAGFIFGVVLIAVGVYFLYRHKKGSKTDGYVWVGHGDDPFQK